MIDGMCLGRDLSMRTIGDDTEARALTLIPGKGKYLGSCEDIDLSSVVVPNVNSAQTRREHAVCRNDYSAQGKQL